MLYFSLRFHLQKRFLSLHLMFVHFEIVKFFYFDLLGINWLLLHLSFPLCWFHISFLSSTIELNTFASRTNIFRLKIILHMSWKWGHSWKLIKDLRNLKFCSNVFYNLGFEGLEGIQCAHRRVLPMFLRTIINVSSFVLQSWSFRY